MSSCSLLTAHCSLLTAHCSLLALISFPALAQPESIAASVRPSFVVCCIPDGRCAELAEADCEAWQVEDETAANAAATAQQSRARFVSDPEKLSENVLLNRADLVEAVVDRCGDPRRRPQLGKSRYLKCTVRLGLDGGGESIQVEWPYYSHRWEAGHPNFQDPVEGISYWFTFDQRQSENVVFHARKMRDATQTGDAQ
jgi:hypothetical protein